jgi:hypothetical protein
MPDPQRARLLWSVPACAALALLSGAGCSNSGGDDASGSAMHSGTMADTGKPDASLRDSGALDGAVATPVTWVGTVAGTDIALGAVIADGHARMFFCGGERTVARDTHWLQLELDAQGSFEDAADDGFSVQGQVQGATLQGHLKRPDQTTAAFTAEIAREGTLAGLYDGSDDCGKLGLIVRQGAVIDIARAQGACVGPGHAPQQVNPILPIALGTDGAIAVELVTDQGAQRAFVHAVSAP